MLFASPSPKFVTRSAKFDVQSLSRISKSEKFQASSEKQPSQSGEYLLPEQQNCDSENQIFRE